MKFTFTRIKFVFLVFGAYFRVISCECRQSYMTICDTFTDFAKYKDTENLSELMIGSDHAVSNMTSVNLMDTLKLGSYYKLSTLMIIRAINNLELSYGFECTYLTSPVKYVTFYGNVLKNIEEYHFPVLSMKKFSLVNNKIESIKGGAFTYHKVENIDLSDNLMDVIEAEALPSTNATKIITIRNNRLTHIEPGSFPRSLESLNLDKNNFRYLQDEILGSLVNLKELTLSHNKFNNIPKIAHLKELVIFDISSNAISTVKRGTFKNMDNLKLLDLSNNNIASDLILNWLYVPGKQPSVIISLALNRLRSLNLTDIPLDEKTLVLYGNPWDCNIWFQLQKELSGHESKCDLEFLSSGNVPYCINYRSGNYVFSTLWERDVDRFHETVKESQKMSGCILAPERYLWLYPIGFGCVA